MKRIKESFPSRKVSVLSKKLDLFAPKARVTTPRNHFVALFTLSVRGNGYNYFWNSKKLLTETTAPAVETGNL